MPLFDYVIRDQTGKINRGSMESQTADDVVSHLQRQGMLVMSVLSKASPTRESAKQKPQGIRLHRRVKTDDLLMFARQLAILLDAGITLIKSLDILSDQIESVQLAKVLEVAKKDIQGGATFRDALATHPKVFSEFWVNLVETGETSGHLPLALNQIVHYLEGAASFQRKIVSAMIYPAVLIFVALAAILIFITRIVPIFSGIFQGFGSELPWLTTFVIDLSSVVRKYLLLGVGLILGLVWLGQRYNKTDGGRVFFDKWKLRLPLLGTIFRMSAILQFSRGLGTLLESGVPILYAIDITERSVGNKIIEEQLAIVKDTVRRGESMAGPMQKSGVFPPMVVQMVMVGEEVGEVAQMLRRVSDFYEQRLDTYVSRLTTLFEPVVLVVMGGVVGLIVVAMFLPIFNLSQVVN